VIARRGYVVVVSFAAAFVPGLAAPLLQDLFGADVLASEMTVDEAAA